MDDLMFVVANSTIGVNRCKIKGKKKRLTVVRCTGFIEYWYVLFREICNQPTDFSTRFPHSSSHSCTQPANVYMCASHPTCSPHWFLLFALCVTNHPLASLVPLFQDTIQAYGKPNRPSFELVGWFEVR